MHSLGRFEIRELAVQLTTCVKRMMRFNFGGILAFQFTDSFWTSKVRTTEYIEEICLYAKPELTRYMSV